MTHYQFSLKAKPATPCSVWHLTFGHMTPLQCLNCGWKGTDV